MEAEPRQKLRGDCQVSHWMRYIFESEKKWCLVTAVMIVVPSIVWHVEVGAFLVVDHGIALSVFGSILQVLTLLLMVATALTDPGVLPRRKPQPVRAKSFDVVIRSHPVQLKYCYTCNIYRPPRCSHCFTCDHCIERFDHHCPWLGTCIGKRNYRFFYTFVVVTALLNSLVLVTSVVRLAVEAEIWTKAGPCALTLALALYSFAFGLFTFGLLVFHTYLICVNETTHEHLKDTWTSGNPFDRGSVMLNCKDALLSNMGPGHAQQQQPERLPSAGAEANTESTSAATHPTSKRDVEQDGKVEEMDVFV
eukprot:TRINITY_DN18128_c0_g1_i1.p1 TRINITY_DN18128_c0_g1~~TRINITY_DN18128_c0_g1_i1.p1  ORF type:complete len:327 (+),score=56.03 TRINITY_DN18128_c0_g1_i1:63-983(+)